ncbi:MAG TPA: hypothetical protein VHS03_16235 [Gaiellaceae bacterium]|nr:hypothetical protein [Gaiellaceae bacterium]
MLTLAICSAGRANSSSSTNQCASARPKRSVRYAGELPILESPELFGPFATPDRLAFELFWR